MLFRSTESGSAPRLQVAEHSGAHPHPRHTTHNTAQRAQHRFPPHDARRTAGTSQTRASTHASPKLAWTRDTRRDKSRGARWLVCGCDRAHAPRPAGTPARPVPLASGLGVPGSPPCRSASRACTRAPSSGRAGRRRPAGGNCAAAAAAAARAPSLPGAWRAGALAQPRPGPPRAALLWGPRAAWTLLIGRGGRGGVQTLGAASAGGGGRVGALGRAGTRGWREFQGAERRWHLARQPSASPARAQLACSSSPAPPAKL